MVNDLQHHTYSVGHDNPVHGDLEKVCDTERYIILRFDFNVIFERRNLTISEHLAIGRQHLDRKWDIKIQYYIGLRIQYTLRNVVCSSKARQQGSFQNLSGAAKCGGA